MKKILSTPASLMMLVLSVVLLSPLAQARDDDSECMSQSLITLGNSGVHGRATLTGQYEEAITAQKKALARNPDFWLAHLQLTALYSELGWEKEARAEAAVSLVSSRQV